MVTDESQILRANSTKEFRGTTCCAFGDPPAALQAFVPTLACTEE